MTVLGGRASATGPCSAALHAGDSSESRYTLFQRIQRLLGVRVSRIESQRLVVLRACQLLARRLLVDLAQPPVRVGDVARRRVLRRVREIQLHFALATLEISAAFGGRAAPGEVRGDLAGLELHELLVGRPRFVENL